MVKDWRSRQIVVLVLLGALLEPLGHQLAYLLRYGLSQAVRMQTVGAHAYFPRLAPLSTLAIALGLTAALLVAFGIRLALPRRMPSAEGFGRSPSPPLT